MKSDLLQGIIIVKESNVRLATPRRYKKINVITHDADYAIRGRNLSSASLLKSLKKLRSFS